MLTDIGGIIGGVVAAVVAVGMIIIVVVVVFVLKRNNRPVAPNRGQEIEVCKTNHVIAW